MPNQTIITHQRTEVQIRERWHGILSGEVRFGKFTEEEDKRILKFVHDCKIKQMLEPSKKQPSLKWGEIGKQLHRDGRVCLKRYKKLVS